MRVVAIALLLLSSPALALAQERCVQTLIQDKGRLNLREASSLATMKLLKSSRNNSSNWGLDVTVPIEGIPIGVGAEGAQQSTDDYFEHSTLDWSQERLLSVATQTLSANSVEAYKACLGTLSRSGPRVIAHSATPTEVTLKITWTAPVGAPTTTRSINIDVTGGILRSAFPTEWRTGQEESRIVTRTAVRDFRVAANIGNQTDSQLVAYIPEVTERRRTLMLGSCLGRGGQDGVRLWGPAKELCNGVGGWGSYDAQVRAVTTLGSCIGDGGFKGVRLYGPVGEPCGGFPAWGTYSSPVSVFQTGISSCLGHGNVLAGHRLWGPAGAACGGFNDPVWGTYREFNQRPQ
jgi:hypothetical protein